MYDTLLYLFTSGKLSYSPCETPFHPWQATDNDVDHSISGADLHHALTNERVDIEARQILCLNCCIEFLQDSKLDVPLSYCTPLGSHSAFFA